LKIGGMANWSKHQTQSLYLDPFFLFIFFLMQVELTHDAMLVTGVQNSDSASLCYAVLTRSVATICHHTTLSQFGFFFKGLKAHGEGSHYGTK